MKRILHTTAKASHYSHQAKNYDAFNEDNSKITNQTIEKILKKHRVKTVLDVTCGTGSQVFWLSKRGYEVTGSDINVNMLRVAKQRAKKEQLPIRFIEGDMRTIKVGVYDAVISIFNAVGHLTKRDFEKAMRNVHANLKSEGIYVFDINNLTYLLHDNNITSLTIDWQTKEGDKINRCFQFSTIDSKGILTSYTTSITCKKNGKPKMTEGAQTLQVYSASMLKEMLQRNGFKVLSQYDINGSKFIDNKSERIVMVAIKA